MRSSRFAERLGRRAEAVRALAGLLRTGLAPRQALIEWENEAPPSMRAALAGLGRSLRLGAGIEAAVGRLQADFEEDASALAAVLAVHLRLGGDAARMLEKVAVTIEERRDGLGRIRAAAAGASLSGRLVASLPFAFLLLAPLTKSPFFDPLGLALLASGAGLGGAGLYWMARLAPKPPSSDEPVAMLADLLASVLAEGAPLGAALEIVGRQSASELREALARAGRMVELGASWPSALELTGEARLLPLAQSLRRVQGLGLPAASSLELFAQRLRADRSTAFEERVRRAPVLMIVPLAVCVLPSFLLLGLGPFLRSLSFQ